jgi:hypothetical protein
MQEPLDNPTRRDRTGVRFNRHHGRIRLQLQRSLLGLEDRHVLLQGLLNVEENSIGQIRNGV